MPGFELEPVDGGGPIALPPGETLLGRGPLLRVTDKRVSRHHGLLENNDGQLRIKPTHLNPCFWQSALEDPPRALEKDTWHALHPGELFSLLPGKYIFRVVSTGDDGTQRNSHVSEEGETRKGSREENGLSDPVKPDTTELRTQSAPSDLRQEDDCTPSLKQASTVDSESEKPKAEERRRVLPAWMMQATANAQSPSTPTGVKRGRGKATPSQAKAPVCTQAQRGAPSSGDESEPSETEQSLGKGPKRKRSNEGAQSPSTWKGVAEGRPKGRGSTTRGGQRAPSSGDGSEPSETEHSLRTGARRSSEEDDTRSKASASSVTKARRGARPLRPDTSEESDEAERQAGSSGEPATRAEKRPGSVNRKEAPSPRVPCPYGKECYRKNPAHFKECSHPGDSDYEEEEAKDEDDDRPECPYGAGCYRKNPLHKKEYKHTKDPGKKAARKEADDGAFDDDSFIDDESESGGDDSDYVPDESDDSANTRKRKKPLLRK